ncbi:hypothetical protein GOP47_0000676 [Adiantum capillus-veneris]|uniref:Uncharacterized protein n=1 Tax=Adiantum capillus-veneris TaxID=13818 RepID=A0A9D4VFK0_ADICA|nr:hypothetical protein GOP47_0000676 [Adiantum capillus-veneris]
MIGKQPASQHGKHSGQKYQFLVHLLRITRLPTHLPSPNVDVTPRQHARRDALKVTALYNSHQVSLGDFPVLLNECIIDRKLTCQFSVSKSETQSKLHLYIDQIYSSGLTGHLALDLHEFVREGETEIYVKYPLYANTSHHCRGPVLKVMIKNLGIKNIEPFNDEESDILLLRYESNEKLHNNRVCNTEDTGFTKQDSCFDANGKIQPCHFDEASLSQLEGALSEIGEKLRTLVSSFKSRDYLQNGDYSGVETDYQSSTTSPLLSSVPTGTSVDSRSEIYEEQGVDSDDVFDSSFDLGSSTYPLTIPKHSRTMSDGVSHSPDGRRSQALRQDGNVSSEEAFCESWFSQSTTGSGKNHEIKHHCLEECFICSSGQTLQLNALEVNSARISTPLVNEHSKKDGKEEAPVTRKGLGLLKGLFGAVVVAGVSLLGVRHTNFSGERSQSTAMRTKLGRTSSSTLSSDASIEKFPRQRYSFRR